MTIPYTRTLKQAQEVGYFVERNTSTVKNQFYAWCQKTDHPYLVIRVKSKYAAVCMDLIGNSYRLNETGIKAVEEVCAPWVKKWGMRQAGNTITLYEKIPLNNVTEVASALVGIASNPINRDSLNS